MSGISIEEGIRRLEELQKNLHRKPEDLVKQAGRTYTESIRSEIASVTTGSKLRGVGKFNGGARQGARVGVKLVTQGTGNSASAMVQATGPLHLIERTNRDHTVPRTVGSRRTRTAAGRLSLKRESTGRVLRGGKPMLIGGIGGQWRTGPWKVRGSKGKAPFARGVRNAQNQARIDAIATISKTVGEVVRGGL